MKGCSVILHSDLNCFYASAEMNEHPELRGKPVAVCGSTENRHGIVLAKSYEAKARGVITGQANWQARQACPDLICVEPHYDLYLKYSRDVRKIYRRYSDTIEPFGMDENWISLGYLKNGCDEGLQIAEDIRRTVRNEIGLTVSVGVSFTKTFAKLGSDMKKPDAVTVISPGNYREKIWGLPASDLLYVGPATTRKLEKMNVRTIGNLAQTDPDRLLRALGKNGLMLWQFANGWDRARVMPADYQVPVKSVGHGATCVTDLESGYAVWLVLLELTQDIGKRLRENRLSVRGVQLAVKDSAFNYREYQAKLPSPTQSPLEIAQAAYALFVERYRWLNPVRALTVRGILPEDDTAPLQLDLFDDVRRREKQRAFDDAVYNIRRRFGNQSIRPASLMAESRLAADKCDTVLMPGVMYMQERKVL